MEIIKLSAINSTNSFLKELAQKQDLDNFTTVIANTQKEGKGQQGNSWFSSPHKNLTFSVFVKFKDLFVSDKIYLNFAISLAILDCLQTLKTPKLSIKWPNDILSGNKKLCGILTETNLYGKKIKSAVIGIGINVNEHKFPSSLPKATSLKIINKKNFDLDILLQTLLQKIEKRIYLLSENNLDILEEEYLKHLFKKDVVATFLDKERIPFSGIIKGVSKNGKLQVLLENKVFKEFGIKEIKFL